MEQSGGQRESFLQEDDNSPFSGKHQMPSDIHSRNEVADKNKDFTGESTKVQSFYKV